MIEPRSPAPALDRLRRQDGASRPSPARTRGLLGGAAAVLALVLGKLKLVLLLLFKLGQFVTASWTIVLSAIAYSAYYGHVRFAVGVVLLLFLHECGHALAARALGVPFSAPVFIPFVGAFVRHGRPRSSWDAFVIAAGGPLLGGAAAAACALLGAWLGGTTGELLVVLGYYALTLNLMNLIPAWIFDGASMWRVIEWRAGLAGVALALVALLAAPGGMPLLVIGVAAFQLGRRAWRDRHPRSATPALERLQADSAVPDQASAHQRHLAAFVFFGALVTLTIALHLVQARLPALR